MDPIYGEAIDRLVKNCARQQKEFDQIIEKHLESAGKSINRQKKRALLLELSFMTWNAILISLEKKLAAYPIM